MVFLSITLNERTFPSFQQVCLLEHAMLQLLVQMVLAVGKTIFVVIHLLPVEVAVNIIVSIKS